MHNNGKERNSDMRFDLCLSIHNFFFFFCIPGHLQFPIVDFLLGKFNAWPDRFETHLLNITYLEVNKNWFMLTNVPQC